MKGQKSKVRFYQNKAAASKIDVDTKPARKNVGKR